MGFTPKLCLIEMKVDISGEVEEDEETIRKPRKAMHLVGLVKMNTELALTEREAGKCLERDAAAWLRHGDDAMEEWNERKEEFLDNPVEQYDRELSKPSISCIDF